MKLRSVLVGAAFALLVVLGAMHLVSKSSRGSGSPPRMPAMNGEGSSSGAGSSSSAPAVGPNEKSAPHTLPHAIRDPAKREELRRQLLAAMMAAKEEAEAGAIGAGSAPVARGQRETNDVEEFGRFVTQAVNEDFVRMAQECAKELKSRRPDAGGVATVAFKLLGDKKIGGVVDSAEVDRAKSTVDDAAFETCIRESLYGVYFDPPPMGGEATMRFEVRLDRSDGGVEDVDDFHPVDKRGL